MSNERPRLDRGEQDRRLRLADGRSAPVTTDISKQGERCFLVTAYDSSGRRLVEFDRIGVSQIEAEAWAAAFLVDSPIAPKVDHVDVREQIWTTP